MLHTCTTVTTGRLNESIVDEMPCLDVACRVGGSLLMTLKRLEMRHPFPSKELDKQTQKVKIMMQLLKLRRCKQNMTEHDQPS